jgi:hypothetical protein
MALVDETTLYRGLILLTPKGCMHPRRHLGGMAWRSGSQGHLGSSQRGDSRRTLSIQMGLPSLPDDSSHWMGLDATRVPVVPSHARSRLQFPTPGLLGAVRGPPRGLRDRSTLGTPRASISDSISQPPQESAIPTPSVSALLLHSYYSE